MAHAAVQAAPSDPGNTAIAALAILRAGNTLDHGDHAKALRAATGYLLKYIEAIPERRLGEYLLPEPATPQEIIGLYLHGGGVPNRDWPPGVSGYYGPAIYTTATALYLANLLDALVPGDPSYTVIKGLAQKALDKCFRRLAAIRRAYGEWFLVDPACSPLADARWTRWRCLQFEALPDALGCAAMETAPGTAEVRADPRMPARPASFSTTSWTVRRGPLRCRLPRFTGGG